jgi:hypothetical protein
MRKVFLLVLMVFIALGFSVSAWAGTILITTAAELNNVRLNLGGDYKLNNDIDLTAYLAPGGAGEAMWGAAGWEPIGTLAPFTGSFDGGGHVIKGLWIDRGATDFIGLFGVSENATIVNLGVVIDDSKGGVKGRSFIGGLVGIQVASSGSSIKNCYSTGNVTANDMYAGGLVGIQDASGGSNNIENCYATGNITTGNDCAGGLVGYQNASGGGSNNIKNCYATGNITTGNDYAGGLVGIQYAGGGNNSIETCYATGDVTVGNDSAGGLVGEQSSAVGSSCIIKNCGATGNVTAGNNFAGGLAGRKSGFGTNSIAGSYRYTGVVVTVVGVAIAMTDNPTGIHGGIMTAAQIMTQSTYTSSGWQFNPFGPWHWDSKGYPKLGFGVEKFPFGAFATPLTPGGSGGGSGGCNAFSGFGILTLAAFIPLRRGMNTLGRTVWPRKLK